MRFQTGVPTRYWEGASDTTRKNSTPALPWNRGGIQEGFLKASRVPRSIRFGFKPNLPDRGEDTVRLKTEPTGPGVTSGSVNEV